jgi:hypothetical protein
VGVAAGVGVGVGVGVAVGWAACTWKDHCWMAVLPLVSAIWTAIKVGRSVGSGSAGV